MNLDKSQSFDIAWDLKHERLTLGGALTLRAEAEMIAQLNIQEEFLVYIKPGSNDIKKVMKVFEIAFRSSKLSFIAKIEDGHQPLYPDFFFDYESSIENYSTRRVAEIFKTYSIRPQLTWNQRVLCKLNGISDYFNENSVLVSLKNFESDFVGSNANLDIWLTAFSELNRLKDLNFILIGEDFLTEKEFSEKFILSLQIVGIDLEVQLALISNLPLFIGTASGIATPAIFGHNRYTIYKHPQHHAQSMKNEIEDGKFPFSVPGQDFKLSIPTVDVIVADVIKHWDSMTT